MDTRASYSSASSDQVRVWLGWCRGSGRAVASILEGLGSNLVIGNFTALLTVNFGNENKVKRGRGWPIFKTDYVTFIRK